MSPITRDPALLWPLLILAGAGLAWLATRAVGWWSGQYEVTRTRLFARPPGSGALFMHGLDERPGIPWFRITRRWYGPGARVRLRTEAGLFCVLAWDNRNFPVPWLKASPALEDDDAGPFWAPVTDFTPDRVRRLRPSMFRRWRLLPFPLVWEYLPLPAPVRGLRSDA